MSVAELPRTEGEVRPKDDEPLFEVVHGQVVELPPMSFHSNKIATRVTWKLGPYCDEKALGRWSARPYSNCPSKKTRTETAGRTLHLSPTSAGLATRPSQFAKTRGTSCPTWQSRW